MKFLIFFLIFCIPLSYVIADASWKCEDVLKNPFNRCQKYKAKGFCGLQSVARSCQETCELCDAGWTKWGSWTDCSAPRCGLPGQKERVRTCSSVFPSLCRGSYVIVQPCTRANCTNTGDTGNVCGNNTFLCPGRTEVSDCLPKQYICDGKIDCLNGADEESCLLEGGPPDSFIIALSMGHTSCLYVNENSEVVSAWHCPLTEESPFYQSFKWKWSWKHNLRNIENGECMAKNPDSEDITTELCDPDNSTQKWECISSNQFPDFGLALTDRSIIHRFAVIENTETILVKASILQNSGWHLHGTNRTSICSKKLTWKPWSSWSECSNNCVRLGTGLRTRIRVCNGGEAGKGLCVLPSTEEQECYTSSCKPQCPKGFDNTTYAFACYKLIDKEPMNHTEAVKFCQSMEDSGVLLNTKLASDKNQDSHDTFLSLMSDKNISEAYIGVLASSVDGIQVIFNYSNDGSPVGNLRQGRKWHDIHLKLKADGTNGKGSIFQIQSFSGMCLEINKTSLEVVPTACSYSRTTWRFVLNFLINEFTGLCLSRIYIAGSPQFIGEKCDLKKPSENILWSLDKNYIKPMDGNQLLSIKNEILVFYEPIYYKWFADTIYNGPTSLSVARDWQGLWFNIFLFTEDLCITLQEDVQLHTLVLTLEICDTKSTKQRWSWLWHTHIYNRHYSICLGLIEPVSGQPNNIRNNTKLHVQTCKENEKLQMWKMYGSPTATEEGISILTVAEDPQFSITRNCSEDTDTQLEVDELCVNDQVNYLKLLDNSQQPKMEELFMLKNIGYSSEDMCLQANVSELSTNGTSLVFTNCSEDKGSWWRWNNLTLVNNLETNDSLCLTAVNFTEILLKACDNSSEQMWNSVDQERGSHLVLFHKVSNVISLDENGTAVLRDLNHSRWNAMEMKNSGVLPVMKECWNGGSYKGMRTWTESGLQCQSWDKQYPHQHAYSLNDGPFCRNPTSFRSSDLPWCFTKDPVKIWEVCDIPSCPTHLPVILTNDSVWQISEGTEKRAFICESPAECIVGAGYDYNGTVDRSGSGKLCLNWSKRIKDIGLGNSGIVAPNHTFCRNPNKDPSGPWCWVGKYEKEYCSSILQCPVMCDKPPQLFRGHYHSILHAAPGLGYANNTKVIYKCDTGHYRTAYENASFYDIICVNGEWEGIVPNCEVKKCVVPITGVAHATPLNKYQSILYNSSITYRCDPDYLLTSGMVEIMFTCNGHNRWRTNNKIPSRYSKLDSQKLKEFWPISCVAPCDDGYKPISHWCMKMIEAKDSDLVNSNSLFCDKDADILPIEAALDSDVQAMLRNLVGTQVQVNVERVNQPGTFNQSIQEKPIYRSLMSGLYLKENADYTPSEFHIATKNLLEINNSTNRTEHFCLSASNSSNIKFVDCEGWENDLSLFRWISTAHIMHVQSKLCLAGSGSNVILDTCDMASGWQKWKCVNTSLVIINGATNHTLYLDKIVDLNAMLTTSLPAGNTDTYSSSFYAGDNMVSSLGENNADYLCSSAYRPLVSLVKIKCDGSNYFVDLRNCTLEPTISCGSDQVEKIDNAEWEAILNEQITNEISCTCTWTEVPTGMCLTTSPTLNFTTTVAPDCTTTELSDLVCPVSGSTVKLGTWCVVLRYSPDGNFSQVIEAPCDSPVSGKMCAKKSRFLCPKPVSLIQNGYRLKPGVAKQLNHSINQIPPMGRLTGYSFGATATYKCDDGFMFSDGLELKEIHCLKDGAWSLDPRLFQCLQRFCVKPNAVAFADPFAINQVSLPVGTEIVVSCLQGYMVSEEVFAQVSTCSAGGKWMPPLAKCISLMCPKPPPIPDMEVFGNSNKLNSVVTYKCKYGYHVVLPDGSTSDRSEHRCDSSALWLPSPLLLKCESTVCGNVQNILESKGSGIGQILTLGCPHGDTLYNGTKLIGGNLTAVCDHNGNWKPLLNNIKCGKTPCAEPVNDMKNSRLVKWTNADPDLTDTPVYQAKAEYFCDDGFFVLHTFRIFVSSHSDKGCLGVDSVTGEIIHAPDSVCLVGGNNMLLWQWHPEDSNLLRQISSGLCLSSSLDTWNIVSQGHAKVVLEECVLGDKRQSWICQSGSGLVNLVALMETSDFGDTAYLHYDPYNGGAIASIGLQNNLAHWSLSDGSMICLMKQADRTFYHGCSRAGKWVPGTDRVACHPTTCRIPPDTPRIEFRQFLNPESFVGGMDVKFGESLFASCRKGLRNVLGRTSIDMKCSNMRTWNPSVSSLKCEPIRCPPLFNITNIYIVEGDKMWSYLSEVKLKCYEGMWFEDIKQPSRWVVCGRDGTWSLPPYKLTCSPVQCRNQLEIPFSTNLNKDEDGTSFNDFRTITCEEGYWIERLRFETIVRCWSDGEWRPNVTCKPVTCSQPPYLQYATLLDNTYSNWNPSRTVTYTCSQYRYVNEVKSLLVTCSNTGQWFPDPNSLTCEAPGCIPLRDLVNNNTGVSGVHSNIGSTVNVTCSDGYVMLDGNTTTSNATCRTDRKWFPPTGYLDCQPLFCGNLPKNVQHGTWRVNEGYTYQSTATLTCDEAYFLPNFDALTHVNAQCDITQKWIPDPTPIECTSIRCYSPLPQPHTNFTALHNKSYAEFGDNATLVCGEGYWFEPLVYQHALTCNSSGQWFPNPSSIHCLPVTCTDPGFILYSTREVVTGVDQSQPVDVFSYKILLEYKCLKGFWNGNGVTQQRTVCNKTGQWTTSVGDMKPCKPVTCTLLPTVLHADIISISSSMYGAHGVGVKITYKCRKGWWFFGKEIINSTLGVIGNETLQVKSQYVTCMENGEWYPDPKFLQCNQKTCPELPEVNNTSPASINSKLEVKCPAGYMVVGSDKKTLEITCNDMGDWEGLPSTDNICERISCGMPRDVLHGKYVILTDTLLNDEAIYQCNFGYSVSKSAKTQLVKCSESLNWEPTDFQCVEDSALLCDLPPYVEHAIRFLPGRYSANEEAVYVCDDHYWIAGNTFRLSVTCGANGMWSPNPSDIVCHPVTCVSPDTPANSTRTMDAPVQPHYKSKTWILYSCNTGHWMEGKYVELKTVCQSDGTWVPAPSSTPCVPFSCPTLPDVEHGSYELYANQDGDLEAKYTCEVGYLFSPSLLSRTQFFTTSCIGSEWVPLPYQRICERLICAEPYLLTNAFFNLGSISHGAILTYYCIPGYEFIDDVPFKTTNCDDLGNWNPDPKSFVCEAIDCGPPLHIKNTTLQVETTTYSSVATYKCADGMIIEGTSSVVANSICTADRRWTPPPTNVARCTEVVCESPPPTYDHVSHSSGTKHYGYAWTYYCKPGFLVEKSTKKFKVFCKSDGEWSHATGKCVASSCGVPPAIKNSKLTNYTRLLYDNERIDETAIYECRHGFWMSNGIRKSFSSDLKCIDGEWSPLISTVRCVDVSCDVLEDLPISTANTTRSHIKYNPVFGSHIKYSCNHGYFFKDLQKRNITVNCKADGFWSTDVRNFECEKVFCLPSYDDPNAMWSHNSLFHIGSTARTTLGSMKIHSHKLRQSKCDCELHRVLGKLSKTTQLSCFPNHWIEKGMNSIALTCDENGVWSPQSKCLPMSCPTPFVEKSWFNVSGSTDVEFPVTSTVQIHCFPGYFLTPAVDNLVCELSSEWNPSHRSVKCQPVNCVAPVYFSDFAQLSGATDFNSSLTLRCDEGFMISPGIVEIKSICQADKTWSIDLTNYTCVLIQCEHSGNIANGDIVADSNPPLYKHREVVRITCLQGYWIGRNIRQFSTKCGDDASWEPPTHNVTCQPVTCPVAQEKNFAVRSSENRTVGAQVTYSCDPIHWLSKTVDGKVNLLAETEITITCLEGGEWDSDPHIIACTSIRTTDKLPVTPTTNRVVATGPSKWLSDAVINGPGDGTEVGEWIDRVENGFLGRSNFHSEIEDSFDDENYRDFFENLSEIIGNITCCNITLINGSVVELNQFPLLASLNNVTLFNETLTNSLSNRTLNDSTLYDAYGRLFLESNSSVSYDYIEAYDYAFSPEVLQFIENGHEDGESEASNETTAASDPKPALDNILKLKNLSAESRTAVLEQAFSTRKVILPRSSEFPLELSHDESAMWDGDPLTGWTPSPHSISYQIEFHLGSLYLVDQIMLMVSTNVKFNLSFHSNDQSLEPKYHGPITIRKTQIETGCTCMNVNIEKSSYGPVILISNFGEQPATIIHFSFDLPPVIREISYRVAPAQWLQVVAVSTLFYFLLTLAIIFILLFPILLILDYSVSRENYVMWFGGIQDGDGVPCILQIHTKKPFKTPMDVFICVKTQDFSPIAWFNKALHGRQTLGFFVHRPVGPDILLYIACSPSNDSHLRWKKVKPWLISGIEMWCGGKHWKWVKNRRNCFIKPNQRYQFNLHIQKPKKTNCFITFLKVHVLSFLWPFHSIVCREHFSTLHRLVSTTTCLSLSLLTFVMINVFHHGIDSVELMSTRFFILSRDSLICLSISLGLGLLLLLLLRFTFVGLAHKQRRQQQMGKTRMAVLEMPGISLYNLMMTGKLKPKPIANESKRKRSFISRLFPTNSILVAWRKERRDDQHRIDKSKSIPGALFPSAAPKLDEKPSVDSLFTETNSETETSTGLSSSISDSLPGRINFTKSAKFLNRTSPPSSGSGSVDISSIANELISTDLSSTTLERPLVSDVTLRKPITMAKSTPDEPASKLSKEKTSRNSLSSSVYTMLTSDSSISASSGASTVKKLVPATPPKPNLITSGTTTESSNLLTSSDLTSGISLSTIKGDVCAGVDSSSKLSSSLKTPTDSSVLTSSLLTSVPSTLTSTLPPPTMKRISSSAPESSLTKPSCCSETTTTDSSLTVVERQADCVDCRDIKWNSDEVFRTCLQTKATLANGRRTIFPTPSHIKDLRQPSLITLLITSLTLISLSATAVAYYFVSTNNTGPNAQFLYDGVFIVIISAFVFITLLEALIIVILGCYKIICQSINLEKEPEALILEQKKKRDAECALIGTTLCADDSIYDCNAPRNTLKKDMAIQVDCRRRSGKQDISAAREAMLRRTEPSSPKNIKPKLVYAPKEKSACVQVDMPNITPSVVSSSSNTVVTAPPDENLHSPVRVKSDDQYWDAKDNEHGNAVQVADWLTYNQFPYTAERKSSLAQTQQENVEENSGESMSQHNVKSAAFPRSKAKTLVSSQRSVQAKEERENAVRSVMENKVRLSDGDSSLKTPQKSTENESESLQFPVTSPIYDLQDTVETDALNSSVITDPSYVYNNAVVMVSERFNKDFVSITTNDQVSSYQIEEGQSVSDGGLTISFPENIPTTYGDNLTEDNESFSDKNVEVNYTQGPESNITDTIPKADDDSLCTLRQDIDTDDNFHSDTSSVETDKTSSIRLNEKENIAGDLALEKIEETLPDSVSSSKGDVYKADSFISKSSSTATATGTVLNNSNIHFSDKKLDLAVPMNVVNDSMSKMSDVSFKSLSGEEAVQLYSDDETTEIESEDSEIGSEMSGSHFVHPLFAMDSGLNVTDESDLSSLGIDSAISMTTSSTQSLRFPKPQIKVYSKSSFDRLDANETSSSKSLNTVHEEGKHVTTVEETRPDSLSIEQGSEYTISTKSGSSSNFSGNQDERPMSLVDSKGSHFLTADQENVLESEKPGSSYYSGSYDNVTASSKISSVLLSSISEPDFEQSSFARSRKSSQFETTSNESEVSVVKIKSQFSEFSDIGIEKLSEALNETQSTVVTVHSLSSIPSAYDQSLTIEALNNFDVEGERFVPSENQSYEVAAAPNLTQHSNTNNFNDAESNTGMPGENVSVEYSVDTEQSGNSSDSAVTSVPKSSKETLADLQDLRGMLVDIKDTFQRDIP